MEITKFISLIFVAASILITCTSCEEEIVQVPCEKINIFNWNHPLEEIKTCQMNITTIITSTDVICSEPENLLVRGLNLSNNKNIKYLPIEIDMSFPNLIGYSAANCKIEAITKYNFKNLYEVKMLWLLQNKIERIMSDTFEDLASLEILDLRKIGFSIFF